MHSPRSVGESAPVPHSETIGVTNGYVHRCFPFPVQGKSDEFGIYGEQHDVGGYPAADRRHVGARTRCLFSLRSPGFRR